LAPYVDAMTRKTLLIKEYRSGEAFELENSSGALRAAVAQEPAGLFAGYCERLSRRPFGPSGPLVAILFDGETLQVRLGNTVLDFLNPSVEVRRQEKGLLLRAVELVRQGEVLEAAEYRRDLGADPQNPGEGDLVSYLVKLSGSMAERRRVSEILRRSSLGEWHGTSRELEEVARLGSE